MSAIQVSGMTLALEMRVEELAAGFFLLSGERGEPFREADWRGILVPDLRRFLALSLQTYFVTGPSFGRQWQEVPKRCQFLLWEENAGQFGILVPVLDGDFRAEASGSGEGLVLSAECGPAGRGRTEVALAVTGRGSNPFVLVERAMEHVVRWMGRGRMRVEKRTQRWMEYLGWCTWDAFYTEVDEVKILAGLEAFREGGVMPGQVIIDEGWQDCPPTKYLASLGLKEGAFTEGRFQNLMVRAKGEFGVQMVGCWRTLFGQLRGVDVDAPGLAQFRRRLVPEPGTEKDTFGVVELEDVPRFHDEYAARLAADGVDFVKVDFQSALHLMTYGEAGRAEAARVWQHSLQDSVEKHFQGEMLNCMAMGSDQVYHTLHSNVCRSSDDFYPTKTESHPIHIRQNLYNALWLAPLQWPDWDMFQSQHPWAFYHAVGRAISGGPVYVSDKPGQSDFALLGRFVAADGKVLRCPQPALTTRETLFSDPMADHSLIKAFNRCGAIGLLAVFHPSPEAASPRIHEEIGAWQVEGLNDAEYAVYSLRQGFLGAWGYRSPLAIDLAASEADLFVFSPIRSVFAPLGLVEKLNPPAAILSVESQGNGFLIEARGGGRFGFYSTGAVREVRVDGLAMPCTHEGNYYTFDTGKSPRCRIRILRE